ncbi:MAG: SIR2 family protein [Marinifilaceae bacterium]
MKKHLTHFVDKYIKAINNENASIFAGAGLSVASGLVNWKGLLTEIADELNLDINKENDLIALAQYYENEKGGRGSINSQLIDEFTKDIKASENHNILASLPIQTFWTTNYDTLIEKSLENFGKAVDVKICSENLATNKPRRDAVIYKMHGDISLPHEAILTKDDYESYNEKRQLFTTALQGDLVSKTFLFIGFSFEDPNLDYILSRIRILLGNNSRDHYCFFKTINRVDYESEEEYNYSKIKQELKIKDLKRYRIQALLVEKYSDITDVLKLIQIKLKRQNIFISGAVHNYGIYDKIRAEKLIFDLSKKLAEKKYKIISGFGLGIGSSVINGVLSFVYASKRRHLDDYLVLRPFPQNISDSAERKKLWKEYREDMISDAGIALFFFGNKIVDGKVVDSDGLYQEFEVAISQNVKVIPVGCTGFVSKTLWDKVTKSVEEYYPAIPELIKTIASLGDSDIKDIDLINNVVKAIDLLQKNI